MSARERVTVHLPLIASRRAARREARGPALPRIDDARADLRNGDSMLAIGPAIKQRVKKSA